MVVCAWPDRQNPPTIEGVQAGSALHGLVGAAGEPAALRTEVIGHASTQSRLAGEQICQVTAPQFLIVEERLGMLRSTITIQHNER